VALALARGAARPQIGSSPELRDASREGEKSMKHVIRALSALALVAVAAPALPCGDKAETHASTTKPSASATSDKQAVAKSDAKKADAKKGEASKQKTTATN
jgi:hypothetical protein